MKRLRFARAAIAAVCLVALAGCAALEGGAEKVRTLKSHVTTLKEKGCDKVPEGAKRLLVVLIKSRIPDYPPNGICDPDWVRDVLVERLPELEAVSDESGVYNGSEDLGYSAGSWQGSLGKPDSAGILFVEAESVGGSAGWLSDGSGLNSSLGALVYVSSLDVHSGSGSDSRLLLYASVQQHEQVAGGFGSAGSYGLCDNSGSDVEAQCCVGGCSSGWSRQLVV